jgi:hypothetical protein
MSDPYHEDRDSSALDVADEPVVSYTVFPEAPDLRSFQRFAKAAGLIEARDAVPQESHNPSSRVVIEF